MGSIATDVASLTKFSVETAQKSVRRKGLRHDEESRSRPSRLGGSKNELRKFESERNASRGGVNSRKVKQTMEIVRTT